MSLLIISRGITKLSELEIDADKDWQLKGITNIKQVASGMGIGHVTQQDGSIMSTLAPGVEGHVLTSRGPGKLVYWGPATTYFWRVFAALLEAGMSVTIITPIGEYHSYPIDSEYLTQLDVDDPTHLQKLSVGMVDSDYYVAIVVPMDLAYSYPMASSHREQVEVDDPSHYMKLNQCDLGTGGVFQIPTPLVYTGNPPMDTNAWLLFIEGIGGAVAYDAPTYTDETAQALNATANDMTLLPAAPALGDCYYFGSSHTFTHLKIFIGQAGAGIWTISWEYWNGTAWVAIGTYDDDSQGFTLPGQRYVFITPPGDWALTRVPPATGSNLYWVRARVTVYTGITTQPKGSQAWVNTP